MKELQTKHEVTLAELEDVQSKLHNKEDYCVRLQASAKSLGIPEIYLEPESDYSKQDDVEEEMIENDRKSNGDKGPESDHNTALKNKINELEGENAELQNKLDTGDQKQREKIDSQSVLISTYINQIEKLDKENTSLKEKFDVLKTITVQFDELDDNEKVKLIPIVEQQVKKRSVINLLFNF